MKDDESLIDLDSRFLSSQKQIKEESLKRRKRKRSKRRYGLILSRLMQSTYLPCTENGRLKNQNLKIERIQEFITTLD